MEFIDTDTVVQQQSGCTIQDIVQSLGWQGFRALEQKVIEQISSRDRLSIATGGGVIMEPRNVELLKKNGFFVWLKADPEVLEKRMQKDLNTQETRPALKGKNAMEEIRNVLAQRERLYARAADLVVDTNSSDIDQVTETIIANIELMKREQKDLCQVIP